MVLSDATCEITNRLSLGSRGCYQKTQAFINSNAVGKIEERVNKCPTKVKSTVNNRTLIAIE